MLAAEAASARQAALRFVQELFLRNRRRSLEVRVGQAFFHFELRYGDPETLGIEVGLHRLLVDRRGVQFRLRCRQASQACMDPFGRGPTLRDGVAGDVQTGDVPSSHNSRFRPIGRRQPIARGV